MSAITNMLRTVLDWIYSIIHNYGWSIVIFTILIKMVLLPLDFKSRQGMRKMQRIQPELNALQKKYANDKQKLQQKQSELMRRERYNPLSGCLPLLIQMPILFAMFGAMRNLANEQTVKHIFEYLSGATPNFEGWLWVKNIWMPDSPFATMVPDLRTLQTIPHDVWQHMFAALGDGQKQQVLQTVGQTVQNFAGALDFSSAAAFKGTLTAITGALSTLPQYVQMIQPVAGWANLNFLIITLTVYQRFNGYLILPVLAGLTQVIMTKLNPATAAPQPAAAGGASAPGMGGFMKYFFPLFSVFICLTSNAGFALYWVVSNLVASATSLLITRYYDNKEKREAPIKGDVTIQ